MIEILKIMKAIYKSEPFKNILFIHLFEINSKNNLFSPVLIKKIPKKENGIIHSQDLKRIYFSQGRKHLYL